MERIAQLVSTADQVVDLEWSGFDPGRLAWPAPAPDFLGRPDAGTVFAFWVVHGVFMARAEAQRVRIHVDGNVVVDLDRPAVRAVLGFYGPAIPLP